MSDKYDQWTPHFDRLSELHQIARGTHHQEEIEATQRKYLDLWRIYVDDCKIAYSRRTPLHMREAAQRRIPNHVLRLNFIIGDVEKLVQNWWASVKRTHERGG